MVTISNEADLIDLLENSQEYRRAVLRWIAYKEPLDLSADVVADEAVNDSLAAVLAGVVTKVDEHSATLARLDALIVEVVEMQRRSDARMDAHEKAHNDFMREMRAEFKAFTEGVNGRLDGFERSLRIVESRVGNDWGQMLERRLAGDYDALIRGVESFQRIRLVRDASGRAQIRHRDVINHEDSVESALDEGRIATGDDGDLARADLICYGVRTQPANRMWFVGESSSVIDANDIARARRWADILRRIYPAAAAQPFAYGISVAEGCEARAEEMDVMLFLVEERA